MLCHLACLSAVIRSLLLSLSLSLSLCLTHTQTVFSPFCMLPFCRCCRLAAHAAINSCTLGTLLLSLLAGYPFRRFQDRRISLRCSDSAATTTARKTLFFVAFLDGFFALYKQIHKNKSLVGHVGASGLVSAILPHTRVWVCVLFLLALLLLLLATCLRIEICWSCPYRFTPPLYALRALPQSLPR